MPQATEQQPDASHHPATARHTVTAHAHVAGILHHPATDMGRRAAARREELGLTREEVARRCGAAATYIEYVEEHAATPGISVMLRLAAALDTTVAELNGGTADLPPGHGMVPRNTELRELAVAECHALLSTHGVGRLGLVTPDGPAIVPVNYVMTGVELAFRTAPGPVLTAATGAVVAFEVDHIDDACCQGWTVLAVGRARAVTDAEKTHRLEIRAGGLPWAGGRRGLWLALVPTRIRGRRLVNPQCAHPCEPSH
ncbi:helix-turn-helix domain-containing protein [Streptomyces sp. NPDC002004]